MTPVRAVGGVALICGFLLGVLAPTYNGQFVIGIVLMVAGCAALVARDPREPR